MPIYKVNTGGFDKVPETTFAQENLLERRDIQKLLCKDIDVIANDLMVIAEEFSDWEDSSRRIDVLCLDKQGRKVVLEIKRTEDGGHMELQAVRYAAMISAMTLDHLIAAHVRYLKNATYENAKSAIVTFLGASSIEEGTLSTDVRIILLGADFSTELTTTVLWLRRKDIDIKCVRLKPYKHNGDVLIDVHQVIPPPEATDYEVKLRALQQEEHHALTLRQERLLRFWKQFIENSRKKSSLFANRSPTTDQWLSSGIGIGGFNINVTVMQVTARLECYIDMGRSSDDRNLEILRTLKKDRSGIEADFGDQLDWQEIEESRGCRICKIYAGGWKSPEDEWQQLNDELINGADRLEKALKPRISKLRL